MSFTSHSRYALVVNAIFESEFEKLFESQLTYYNKDWKGLFYSH